MWPVCRMGASAVCPAVIRPLFPTSICAPRVSMADRESDGARVIIAIKQLLETWGWPYQNIKSIGFKDSRIRGFKGVNFHVFHSNP